MTHQRLSYFHHVSLVVIKISILLILLGRIQCMFVIIDDIFPSWKNTSYSTTIPDIQSL